MTLDKDDSINFWTNYLEGAGKTSPRATQDAFYMWLLKEKRITAFDFNTLPTRG